MTNITQLSYLFRNPQYPVIIDVEEELVAGRSARQLFDKLSRLDLVEKESYQAIDKLGEGWSLYVVDGNAVLSPITFRKRRTKLELIRWFNNRKNKPADEVELSERSLSSKRLDSIVSEIADRLIETAKHNKSRTGKGGK